MSDHCPKTSPGTAGPDMAAARAALSDAAPQGLRALMRAAAAYLADSPSPSVRDDAPRLTAELFVARALNLPRQDLLLRLALHPAALVPDDTLAQVASMLARRAAGEPTAHILGEREFYGRDFLVTPATLIPRPETELLVETALSLAPRGARFADCGTGTGCIAVTLCAERDDLCGMACDISPDALAVAARNIVTHLGGALEPDGAPPDQSTPDAARRAAFILCQPVLADFTRPLFRHGSLDLLVSNPPYVSEAEHEGLTREVRDREPRSALVPCVGQGMDDAAAAQGRVDGPGHARILVAEAGRALRPGGLFLMEFGCAQGQAVADLFLPYSRLWTQVDIRRDLAGLDRYVVARREPSA
ncbi:HemK/PrmC family methyltransferase [Nitratidesulfovibrio liaohensis]|uniref:Release factor glutamine methyltransferase n=1 Tax=Nitratidesulfovibrio liaohensis TaxID=2604158 RepID=A0ABY9R7G9_9BACT|nr:HemK/PrmC family methyltransferase [Nitratidesulfovibrio liaohensis]WMW67077.1 peptide chain release factor N(5)-glutamine methyltransferase [Nitratidesulfovibrio liaohensis]